MRKIEINSDATMSKEEIKMAIDEAMKKIFEKNEKEKTEKKDKRNYLLDEMIGVIEENEKLSKKVFDDSATTTDLIKVLHVLKNENTCFKGILKRRNRH